MSDENGKEVLFEVTEDHLDTGLRGIPVGTCRTSFVDPKKGVHYCGYPVGDLADMDPEDVIFLLFEKRLPNRQESQDFRHELAQRAERLPTGALRVLESLTPSTGHPMDWLSIGIQALGVAETTGDIRADGLNLISRMPELMATIFRLRGGRGLPEVASEPSRGNGRKFRSFTRYGRNRCRANDSNPPCVPRSSHGPRRWQSFHLYRKSSGQRMGEPLRINLQCNECSIGPTARSCQSILP